MSFVEMAQPIEYERAKVIYRGRWRYLSWQGLVGGGVAGLLAVFGVVFMRGGGQLPYGRLFAWGCIVAGLAGVGVQGAFAVMDRRKTLKSAATGLA